jgi:hypothetical protein
MQVMKVVAVALGVRLTAAASLMPIEHRSHGRPEIGLSPLREGDP